MRVHRSARAMEPCCRLDYAGRADEEGIDGSTTAIGERAGRSRYLVGTQMFRSCEGPPSRR